MGWFDENSGKQTHPVRALSANQWGLYDMHGNVWEWCEDGWGEYASDEQENPVAPDKGLERVLRGGSWVLQALYCRSAFRHWGHPSSRNHLLGFRLASGQLSQAQQAGEERAAGKPGGTEARGAPAASDGA